MTTARGVVAGVVRAEQHLESIAVSSGAPVTPIDSRLLTFPRPLGSVPVVLGSFLEHESAARGHLLQLVIDAASVPEEKRPRGLADHIARLWRAVDQLLFTGSSAHCRRLIDPVGIEACHRTAEKFLMLSDRPESDYAAPGILHDSVAGIIIDRINVALAGDGPHFARVARNTLERIHDDLLFLAPTRRGRILAHTVAGRILEQIREVVGDDGPTFSTSARRAMLAIREQLMATAHAVRLGAE
jgi:hypothetical protein